MPQKNLANIDVDETLMGFHLKYFPQIRRSKMKKIIIALLLTLAFTVSALAEGNIPISGFAGCEGGLYYPDEKVCCMPNEQCPAGLSANVSSVTKKDIILADLITMLKNIYF
jgi:hypothetical protein